MKTFKQYVYLYVFIKIWQLHELSLENRHVNIQWLDCSYENVKINKPKTSQNVSYVL